ncbi:LysR family transcriptional regulator [Azotobacter chroococcum]|nr:LysR family transcriptional regulator [Azotobacter chroococcum]
MEIRQLKYFVAVAEELNFNRAAERLYITQPALSRQIQQLEEAIPAVLLERNSKRVALTDAGQAFYQQALNILAQLQHAADESRLLAEGKRGSLVIGIFGSSILDFIPQVLLEFGRTHPAVEISLHPMDKDAQIQALRERRLSIGFNRLVPDEPDIEQELVRREALMLALPAKHALAERDSIELGEVLEEPFILYPRGVRKGLTTHVRRLFADYDATPRVVQEVTDVTTSIALVAGGLGLCVVPQSTVNLRLPGVEYRALRCRGKAEIELACLYRKGDSSPILRAFLDTVRQLGSQEATPAADNRQAS